MRVSFYSGLALLATSSKATSLAALLGSEIEEDENFPSMDEILKELSQADVEELLRPFDAEREASLELAETGVDGETDTNTGNLSEALTGTGTEAEAQA